MRVSLAFFRCNRGNRFDRHENRLSRAIWKVQSGDGQLQRRFRHMRLEAGNPDLAQNRKHFDASSNPNS